MLTKIEPQLDYETQINEFLINLSEVAKDYDWKQEFNSIRGYDLNGKRVCPLSAIILSYYYQDLGVDAKSAGRFLGISSYVVSKIIAASDGDWASVDTLELRDRIKFAIGLSEDN